MQPFFCGISIVYDLDPLTLLVDPGWNRKRGCPAEAVLSVGGETVKCPIMEMQRERSKDFPLDLLSSRLISPLPGLAGGRVCRQTGFASGQ